MPVARPVQYFRTRAARAAPQAFLAVLAGTQHLTREQLGTLARYFQVSPSVFAFGE